ncbi:MAG: hypothetical protein KTR25_01210 [Myxococcales bacterium]|nr:hypothetical protein [Myxococcales bacterium]
MRAGLDQPAVKSFRPKDEDDDDGDSNRWAFLRAKAKEQSPSIQNQSGISISAKGFGQGRQPLLLIENRNGLIKDVRLTIADGSCECEAALDMLK